MMHHKGVQWKRATAALQRLDTLILSHPICIDTCRFEDAIDVLTLMLQPPDTRFALRNM
jgi:hypothetical protein